MLGEEGEVHSGEYNEELSFSSSTVECKPREEGESMGEGPKDSEYSSHSKNIMEMSGYVICVMKNDVNR